MSHMEPLLHAVLTWRPSPMRFIGATCLKSEVLSVQMENGSSLVPTHQPTSNQYYRGKSMAADDNIDAVLKERGSRYGAFATHATISQDLKRNIDGWCKAQQKILMPDQKEALDMICHKIARIINGDPDYADSWVDIAGYAKLVADRLNGIVR